jgi:hypothetical protein
MSNKQIWKVVIIFAFAFTILGRACSNTAPSNTTSTTTNESSSTKSDWEKEVHMFEEMDRMNLARELYRMERERRELDKYREEYSGGSQGAAGKP